jgi:probable F420-dependent oxidoreductase
MPALRKRGIMSNTGLPIEDRLRIGIQTIHRRSEPAVGAWLPTIDEMGTLVGLVDRSGYDSLWVGDHVSFHIAIFDPLLQLAQAAVISRRLVFGTGVYLVPLRHPTPTAKQVSTLDHLTEGRFIFGVGVGGEFPKEFEACGVPVTERGARLEESLSVMRKLWSGKPATHDGRFFKFEGVTMQPPPRQAGGPPIWCGGRSDAALRRIGRMTDGWMFTRIDDTYEKALDAATVTLSQRYGMDFRKAAQRYCALGPPERVAETIVRFHEAGVRHVILDFVGPYEERDRQIERFASEALPLLAGLRG